MKCLILIGMVAAITLEACQKSEPTQELKEAIPHISSINPEHGPYGTLVTIQGENFDSNFLNDIVLVNGKIATIQSATDTSIVVIVPKGAGSGQIKLTINGNTIVSAQEFKYEYTAVVSTIAGSGDQGLVDGPSSTAQFNYPTGLALDVQGNIYVLDKGNSCIRKITPAGLGLVTTFAGSGITGFAEGQGIAAQFNFNFIPGLAIDDQGNLYVADGSNNRIRKITPSGSVSTIAGDAPGGYADGQGTNARFNAPSGITIDSKGNLYVSEPSGNRIRKITPSGTVSTFAGSGVRGDADGQGTNSSFSYPAALSTDNQDNIYVADNDNRLVRKITSAGLVSTYAGKGIRGIDFDIYVPTGVGVDRQDNIYIGGRPFIYKVEPDDSTYFVAGTTPGFADGPGVTALFGVVAAMIEDADGNILVADALNNRIRKITFE